MRWVAMVSRAVRVRILYHREPEGFWAESPDLPGWTVAGGSYAKTREMAQDGVAFGLACQAEDRGEAFDQRRFARVSVEHYVQAPA